MMRWKTQLGWIVVATLSPATAWATEAAMPLGAVFLSGAGGAAIGFAGFVCLKIYGLLKGGELGSAWQTVAYALLLLAGALLVETVGAAGWLSVPSYVGGLLKLLGAAGLVFSLTRFARVFQ